jgi:hypothetical protein
MDFVTITDHDTIDGALELQRAGYDDVFLSEELTAWFRASSRRARPRLRHHARRPRLAAGPQPRRRGLRRVPARAGDHHRARPPLLRGRGAADPAPPPPPGRALPGLGGPQRLAGKGAQRPRGVYIETHGGTGLGGTDDHAGVDIGRTWTQTPPAATIDAFLGHIRAGRAEGVRRAGQRASGPRGDGIASRALARRRADRKPDPVACEMVERSVARATPRRTRRGDLGPRTRGRSARVVDAVAST